MKNVLGRLSFETISNLIGDKEHDKDIDNLVLGRNPGPQIFETAEEAAYQNYSTGNNPRIYAHENHRSLIQESNELYEDKVHFFDKDSASSHLIEVLEDSSNNEKSVVYGDKQYIEEMEKWVPERCDVRTYTD